MDTYQDLLAVGENEIDRAKACDSIVNRFMASKEYAVAKAADSYYRRHNLTMEKYVRVLHKLSGEAVEDIFSSNHKLTTGFFRRLVIQIVSFILDNGVIFNDDETIDMLGRGFVKKIKEAAKIAMVQGKAFGFWNLDHLEVFGFVDTKKPGFRPLYDETTGELMGGIRFWFQDLENKKISFFTLYEPDGYTAYKKGVYNEYEILHEKKRYVNITISTEAQGVLTTEDGIVDTLPIVQLYANDMECSEMEGMRSSFDCYDFIKSGLANEIDDLSGVFWIIENAGGMDDVDLAMFMQRLKTVHAAAAEGDSGVSVNAHQIQVPFEARDKMLEILRKDIYEDFQAADIKSLSASQKTTQEIQSAFQSQNEKCSDFETYLTDFVEGILEIAGIDDSPRFRRNMIVNETETTSMVLSAQNILPEETIIRHLPFLTAEEADEIISQKEIDGMDSLNFTEDDLDEEEADLDELEREINADEEE